MKEIWLTTLVEQVAKTATKERMLNKKHIYIALFAILTLPTLAFAHGQQLIVMLFSCAGMAVLIIVLNVMMLVFWKETKTAKLIMFVTFWLTIIIPYLLLTIHPTTSWANYFWIHPILWLLSYIIESATVCYVAYCSIRYYRKRLVKRDS